MTRFLSVLRESEVAFATASVTEHGMLLSKWEDRSKELKEVREVEKKSLY